MSTPWPARGTWRCVVAENPTPQGSTPQGPTPQDSTSPDETRTGDGHTPSQPYTVHEDALTPGSTASTGNTAAGSASAGRGDGAGTAVETTPRRGAPDPIALV